MHQAPQLLPCDGCGQLADSHHISRRLQRLEWTTRFRPIHMQTLVLGGISPQFDDEFLYAPWTSPQGEALYLLEGARISIRGKSGEVMLTEFQRLGLFLSHILECPLPSDRATFDARPVLENQLAAVITRIRRSLKPKRVVLVSAALQPLVSKLLQTDLGCPVISNNTRPFLANVSAGPSDLEALRSTLVTPHVQTA